ncbi:MAG: hypothetical protein GX963_00735 [Bacteroidales bacterium]|nr:hypothetical protein [Bacteroidales bacterium]
MSCSFIDPDLSFAKSRLVKYPCFSAFLTDERIKQVYSLPEQYKSHPIKELLLMVLGKQSMSPVLWNTEQAFEWLCIQGAPLESWVKTKFEAYLHDEDYENASAILGEIRALGYLIQTGLNVRPISETSNPTPDFQVIFGEQEKAFVEVATKQMNYEEAERLKIWRNSAFKESSRYIIPPLMNHPAGIPQNDSETVGENVGHKIASIKPKARQASEEGICILWIDLQDQDWRSVQVAHAKPVTISKGKFYSGGLWHGFYGTKGTPTFEAHSLDECPIECSYKQSYPGLFNQDVDWSAAILSLKCSTIIMENPGSKKELPKSLLTYLFKLPGFNYSNSWISWPKDKEGLKNRIEDQISQLEQLQEHAKYISR